MDYLRLSFKWESNQLPIFLFQTMFINITQLNQEKEKHLYIDKNIKYKLHSNDLASYISMKKKMAESTFIEILNKKQKNINGCVYKHS